MSTKNYLSLISLITIIAGVLVVGSVFVTNPIKIGPLGVTVWFVALLAAGQGVIALGLVALKKRLFPVLSAHKLVTSSWRQGLLVAGAVVILVALSSLRQLGWKDALLIIVLLALVEFYFRARV